ncbi:MAG: DUF262 domain-containing protein [Gammaproteobacteria bacterium]|nr:DUF262 domain-containing protein [Gammaproteobacteria bacterium]
MNGLTTCDKKHTISSYLIDGLNINQGGSGRHQCVICAYAYGKEDGEKNKIDFEDEENIETCKHDKKAIKGRIKSIHTNHAPTQSRYKCAICAYNLGYETGLGGAKNDFDEFSNTNEVDDNEIYGISTFGTSAEVITVFNRLDRGTYYVPIFQRDFVWKIPQSSSLIESLIMQLPIPAIFLAKDDDEKSYIIDGQQRLTSIKKFYNDEFALKDTIKAINGKKYSELDEKYRNRLDEYALQLIVVKQDKPDDNNDGIYKIFERINTAGTKLYPQEIRSATYHGEFAELLSELAENEKWIDFIKTKNNRRTHQELILRFFALCFDMENYKAPMKHFLNVYMSKNRHLNSNSKEELNNLFSRVLDIANQHLTKDDVCLKYSNRINTQLLDSILVAIAKNINNVQLNEEGFLHRKITELKDLIDSEEYESREYWESRRTSQENVKGRCEIVTDMLQ